MPSSLEADIAWYRRQIEDCQNALAALSTEMDSPYKNAEARVVMETLGRHQATLEHLLRLRAMIERANPSGSGFNGPRTDGG